jgi:hypothetical protein
MRGSKALPMAISMLIRHIERGAGFRMPKSR